MLIWGRLAMESAKPDKPIATASEARVVPVSYESAIGKERASMPTKCIDQMPQPIDTAPPASQSCAVGLCVLLATRADRFRAVWETNMATAIERRTSQGL